MSRLQQALDQIVAARKYTLRLVEDLPLDSVDWFRQPSEGVTHIAWQIGHLAMAEYRLAIERVRGDKPGDAALISPAVLAQFGKGSIPEPDRARHPTPQELLQVLQRVHEQALSELPTIADADLDAPPVKPHSLFDTKLGSLFWCARHEMMHAGQIGLLRRLQGKPAIW
jgi:hypothetical protein